MGRTACTEPQCLYKGELYILLLNLQAKRDATNHQHFVLVSTNISQTSFVLMAAVTRTYRHGFKSSFQEILRSWVIFYFHKATFQCMYIYFNCNLGQSFTAIEINSQQGM